MKETYASILSSEPAKEYVRVCNLVKEFVYEPDGIPNELKKTYNAAVEKYRDFLREKKINMSLPLFAYDPDDRTTWPYLDAIIYEIKGKRQYITMKENPDWIHRGKIKLG